MAAVDLYLGVEQPAGKLLEERAGYKTFNKVKRDHSEVVLIHILYNHLTMNQFASLSLVFGG